MGTWVGLAGLFSKKTTGKTTYAMRAGQKARERAEKEYEAGRNLRPVEDAPREFLDKLSLLLADLKVVEAATFAEFKDDEGSPSYYVLGLRLRRGSSVPYEEAARRVAKALAAMVPYGKKLECTELDANPEPKSADGSANPYLVFEG
jgi:type III secretion system (T3SS) SseB-like protein